MSRLPHPEITRLKVTNFRSLIDVDIELQPLTVLVGPNGSGKSNTVDALRFMRDAVKVGLERAVFDRQGIGMLISRQANGEFGELSIHLTMREEDEGWTGEYGFALGITENGQYRVVKEVLRFQSRGYQSFELETRSGQWTKFGDENFSAERLPMLEQDGLNLPRQVSPWVLYALSLNADWASQGIEKLPKFLMSLSFYTLNPELMRQPQGITNSRVLDEQGRNILTVLREMKKGSSRFGVENIRSSLGIITGDVEDFEVKAVDGFLIGQLHQRLDGTTRAFTFNQVSNGTLRMLGLLTAIYQEPPRSLIVFEEPELAVHPGALGVVADVLMEARMRSQVVITTHSPELIERLPIESFLVVDKEQGATKIGPISREQRHVIRERLFSASELLRIEGLRRDVKQLASEPA